MLTFPPSGSNLVTAVKNGSVPLARIQDASRRIVASWFLTHQDRNFPCVNFNSFKPAKDPSNHNVDVMDDHAALIKEIGAASIVLLRNKDSVLPLSSRLYGRLGCFGKLTNCPLLRL